MKVLLPYLIGAASTFVVQFLLQVYVVPRVQTRKHVEERWVKDVLDLGEILTTSVQELATEAWKAQLSFRALKNFPVGPEHDLARVEEGLRERKLAAYLATRSFTDLVAYRVVWAADRILMVSGDADQTAEFFRWSSLHRMKLLELGPSVYEDLAEEEFDAFWASERKLRSEMTVAVKSLAYLSRPPRASWRWRFHFLRPKVSGGSAKPAVSPQVQAPPVPRLLP